MNGCPLCGAEAFWPLPHNENVELAGMSPSERGARLYEWRLCGVCGNGYPSYQPDLPKLAAHWERNRAGEAEDDARTATIWQRRREISRKGAVRSYRMFAPLYPGTPGRFLDIACGLGETVKAFAEHGWDAFGVDSDPSVQRLHRELGIKSAIGQVETTELAGRFDVIHIAHAIYFISEPRRFLESLRRHLSEGGLLCIVLADFMAVDDIGLPGYPHSFFPTAGSMRYLLAIAGFRTCLSRRWSGSIYIAARAGKGPLPAVHPEWIRLGYRSKLLRYRLFGVPKLWLHRVGKWLLRRLREQHA